jgi:phosphoglycerate dehydrogenase-like enzyme
MVPGPPEGRPPVGDYRVAVSGDQASPDGSTIFGDIGLARLTAAGLRWEIVPVPDPVIAPETLADFHALLMMGDRKLTAVSLAGTSLRHVARFGGGYDAIDVAACEAAGVVVTNTPDAVRVPMAHAAVTFIFALAHNLVVKDRLVRAGRWADRTSWQGLGLMGAQVGIVGLGGVGTEIARLLRGIGIDVAAYNRSDRREEAAALGVSLLPLDELAAVSDFLVVAVSANPGTAHLIGTDVLARMKLGAYLVNVARGSVVDEDALAVALAEGRLRGAALDVFEREPLEPGSPLLAMEQVVLTPHSLCWTDAFARAVADSAIGAIIDVARGRAPRHPVKAR